MTFRRFAFKSTLYLSALLLLVTSSPLTVSADRQFYSQNDILFYDNDAVECVAGEIVLSGKDNRQKIYNFLTAKGLKPHQAAGVLGNIKNESGYSPTRHEDSHSSFDTGGYGLAQWTAGRRTTLKAHLDNKVPELVSQYYKNTYGKGTTEADGFVPRHASTNDLMPVEDNDALLNAELNFLFDETSSRKITTTTSGVSSAVAGDVEWSALKKATSVADATKIWLYNFEIPANIAQAAIDRTAEAETILALLENESANSTSSSDCVSTTSGDTAALQATVKLYAWPEYHAPSFVKMKPEYQAAINTAKKTGGYTGGINHPGVDCGGFVTRVIVDSGYEPTYNAKNGATEGQKQWLDANWENLGNAASIDVATLRPGDVAMQDGHTFLFAGKGIDGFGTTAGWKGVASSSLDERSPMAGLESLTDSAVTWYRKKGVNYE